VANIFEKLYPLAKAATNTFQLGSIAASAIRVATDVLSSKEEVTDANRAKRLADKKIAADNKAKGGAVTKMYHGGMAHGKKHMYLGGDSSVKDNAGLRALKLKSPATYTKITGRNA